MLVLASRCWGWCCWSSFTATPQRTTLNVQAKAPAAPVKATRAASKPVAVETQATKPVTNEAPVKTGLFTKPTAVADSPKEEPVTKVEAEEEPLAGISTGEDRGEQDDVAQDLDVTTEDAPEEVVADKPKSIFNFAKPAAAG